MRINFNINKTETQNERATDLVDVGPVTLRISWSRSVIPRSSEFKMGAWKWTATVVGHDGICFNGRQYQDSGRDVPSVVEDVGDRLAQLLRSTSY